MILQTTNLTLIGRKYQLDSYEESEITQKHYDNYMNSIDFMRNLGGTEKLTRVSKNHTRLVSISPDKQDKIIRNFFWWG